jgi:hypothetical protein
MSTHEKEDVPVIGTRHGRLQSTETNTRRSPAGLRVSQGIFRTGHVPQLPISTSLCHRTPPESDQEERTQAV